MSGEGNRGQLPSEEQSNAGGGEAGHGGSRRAGPDERHPEITEKEKNTLFHVHIPREVYKEPELERPSCGGRSTGDREGRGGGRLLTHPGASGEKRRRRRGDIIPLDLMD